MSTKPSSVNPGPLVSVIVPAYNYGHVIGQTLEAVLAQTYRRLECIVIDDGSADDTREVVERYAAADARVRYVLQRNAGVSAARNNGLAQSRGDYVQFLDADDLLEPRKVELHVEYLEAHPEVDVVYGSARFFSTERMDERLFSMFDERATSSYIPQLDAGRGGALKALAGAIMPINTALVRRRVVESVGPFDTGLNSVEDSDFWIRCAAKGHSFQYYDPEGTLALVRSHAVSASKNRRNQLRKLIQLRRKVARTVTDEEALRVNRQIYSEEMGYLGVEEVAAGSLLRGLGCLLRAALLSRGARARAKWVACAAAAPFVGAERLRSMPVVPVSRWLSPAPENHG